MRDNLKIVASGARGVDTHAHTFTQELKFIRAGEGYIPDYDASLSSYLNKLDAHGLTHGILIQPSFLGTDNSNLLQAVASRPDRLRCIVIASPEASLEELRRMKNGGAVGIRLILFGDSMPDLQSPLWSAFLQNIVSLDWIVEIYSPASLLPKLAPPLLEYGCRLLIDHYGRPDTEAQQGDPGFQYLLSLGKTGRVWVDLSAPYRNGPAELGQKLSDEYLPPLTKAFGLGHLLWGSDWPCVQYEPWNSDDSACAFLKRVFPDEAFRQVVLWESPARLFNLS